MTLLLEVKQPPKKFFLFVFTSSHRLFFYIFNFLLCSFITIFFTQTQKKSTHIFDELCRLNLNALKNSIKIFPCKVLLCYDAEVFILASFLIVIVDQILANRPMQTLPLPMAPRKIRSDSIALVSESPYRSFNVHKSSEKQKKTATNQHQL